SLPLKPRKSNEASVSSVYGSVVGQSRSASRLAYSAGFDAELASPVSFSVTNPIWFANAVRSLSGCSRLYAFPHILVWHEEIRNQRKTPARDLDFRRMSNQGNRRPTTDGAAPDQLARQFNHDGRDVVPCEEIRAIQERTRLEFVFLEQGSAKHT